MTTPTDPATEERRTLIHSTITRAAYSSRRVFGYSSLSAGCRELPPLARATKGKGKGKGGKKGATSDTDRVPAWWDRICVEGDAEWLRLPGEKVREKKRKVTKVGKRERGKGGDAVVDMAEKAKEKRT